MTFGPETIAAFGPLVFGALMVVALLIAWMIGDGQ